MIVDENLSFLRNCVVVYHAGLDAEDMRPYGRDDLLAEELKTQLIHIKALSLLVDYIIIPPGFFIFWSNVTYAKNFFRQIIDLYINNIILSPVYEGMNSPINFLEYKSRHGNQHDKQFINNNLKILNEFFREMPLFHRNVKTQSKGFHGILEDEIYRHQFSNQFKDDFSHSMDTSEAGILASRSKLISRYKTLLSNEFITKEEYRAIYNYINKAYYIQGASTYESVISIPKSERFISKSKELFKETYGISLGYDPLTILNLLKPYGITKDFLISLPVKWILKFRNTKAFHNFKLSYKEIASYVQQISINVSGLTNHQLKLARERLEQDFYSKYNVQQIHFQATKSNIEFGIDIALSYMLGAIGFLINPLTAAILGFSPLILNIKSEAFTNYLIDIFYEKEDDLFKYIKSLKELSKISSKDKTFTQIA